MRVVDQGTDPCESRLEFAEIATALEGRLRYVRQPNLGGAGGFTRGMFDATAGAPEDDHDVLLLDDDILLEPEILLRLTAFAACTTHPTIVGGQMLNLLHPAHLHISAERADPELLKVGIPMPDALDEAYLLGSDERLLPIGQDRRVDTEYNGWWACLVPATIIRAIGYPLPLFFQWDDIEFGYRARAHGFPTVALPGAGVWHADFGWKDWDEWHRYFNMRNGLITAALHTGFSTRRILRRLGTLLSQYLVAMHYGLAATLIQAVEDFLEGPEGSRRLGRGRGGDPAGAGGVPGDGRAPDDRAARAGARLPRRADRPCRQPARQRAADVAQAGGVARRRPTGPGRVRARGRRALVARVDVLARGRHGHGRGRLPAPRARPGEGHGAGPPRRAGAGPAAVGGSGGRGAVGARAAHQPLGAAVRPARPGR